MCEYEPDTYVRCFQLDLYFRFWLNIDATSRGYEDVYTPPLLGSLRNFFRTNSLISLIFVSFFFFHSVLLFVDHLLPWWYACALGFSCECGKACTSMGLIRTYADFRLHLNFRLWLNVDATSIYGYHCGFDLFPGAFFCSRVAGACPVIMGLIMAIMSGCERNKLGLFFHHAEPKKTNFCPAHPSGARKDTAGAGVRLLTDTSSEKNKHNVKVYIQREHM